MLKFVWDATKAASNLRKHGVSFDEASSIFLDPLAASGADPDHSLNEARYITIGHSGLGRLLTVAHTYQSQGSALSARELRPVAKGNCMKKADMRDDYKRADLPKLERGKFYKEAVKGTVVVLLDPKVAKAFPTSDAVNEALAELLAIAREARKLTEKPKRAPRKRTSA